jgi:mannonate dehydratase
MTQQLTRRATMKLGLGLYRHMLTQENFRFARQAGATHIVAHLADYFKQAPRIPTSSGQGEGWGAAGDPGKPWTFEELRDLKAAVNAEGLVLEAVENFDPAHWYDVLLDGPRRGEQMENVKAIIRNMGRAGIPVMGYNFSIAGVWGHVNGPWARGGAESVGFFGQDGPEETPIPAGMVWNMVYDPQLYDPGQPRGTVQVSPEQLWQRLETFLKEVVPVAEQAGVRLALHPDDPPMPTLRNTARLVYQPDYYYRVLDIVPSRSNGVECCLGTIAEMTEGDIYQFMDGLSKTGQIGYIHFRNVKGKVPHYVEVFVDEGDVDMIRMLRVLHKNGYDGVLIPDHTPQMSCGAPWHAGMAYALGYMRAALQIIEAER